MKGSVGPAVAMQTGVMNFKKRYRRWNSDERVQYSACTTTAKVGANLDLGVSESNIEASFGVDFEESYSLERVYQFDPIPNGKWLTYKAYTNYNVYDFEVYNLGTYVGTSCYWIPVGIVVEHNLI